MNGIPVSIRFRCSSRAELFRAVQNRRMQTAPERTQTPAQKELRKLCGGTPPKYVERQVLGILNRLIHDPQLIAYTPKDNSRILSEQRQALNELLRSPPVDEEQARKLALDCAGAALDSIGRRSMKRSGCGNCSERSIS